jgi:catalase
VNAVRRRVVAQLRNVAEELAQAVADGLGIVELPEPLPRVLKRTPKPEVDHSDSLSLLARPGSDGIQTRHIAILVADGVDSAAATAIHESISGSGAVPRFVGIKLGQVEGEGDGPLDIEVSMEAAPSVVWDGLVIPGGDGATTELSNSGHALEFLKDQYRHCKTILLLGTAQELLAKAGIPVELESGEKDPGLLVSEDGQAEEVVKTFIDALTQHRHYARETNPPRV